MSDFVLFKISLLSFFKAVFCVIIYEIRFYGILIEILAKIANALGVPVAELFK